MTNKTKINKKVDVRNFEYILKASNNLDVNYLTKETHFFKQIKDLAPNLVRKILDLTRKEISEKKKTLDSSLGDTINEAIEISCKYQKLIAISNVFRLNPLKDIQAYAKFKQNYPGIKALDYF